MRLTTRNLLPYLIGALALSSPLLGQWFFSGTPRSRSFAAGQASYSPDVQYWVSTSGSDSNPGTQEQPFATLEKARATLAALDLSIGRTMPGALIHVQAGTYYETLTLTNTDSGVDATHPVEWRAEGGTVVVSGATPISDGAWAQVTSSSDAFAWGRLPAAAKLDGSTSRVYKVNVTSLGIDKGSWGGLYSEAKNMLAVLDDGTLKLMSRWPQGGSDPTQLWDGAELLGAGTGWLTFDYPSYVSGTPSGGFNITVDQDIGASWPTLLTTGQDMMIYGTWGNEFEFAWHQIDNTAAGFEDLGSTTKINVKWIGNWVHTPTSESTYGFAVNQKVAILNGLQFMQEGNYVFCYTSGDLYYWAPGGSAPSGVSVTLRENALVMGVADTPSSAANYVAFTGITFSGARDYVVKVYGSTGLTFTDCNFRDSPNAAYVFEDTQDVSISGGGTEMIGRHIGWVHAGDKDTLTNGNFVFDGHTWENCNFYAREYVPWGIKTSREDSENGGNDDACGVSVRNSTIADIRGGFIALSGPYNEVTDNTFDRTNMIDGDDGAVVTPFRYTDVDMRIERNTFSDIVRHPINSASGGALYVLYLDTSSNYYVQDNVFVNCDHAMHVAAGWGNVIARNKFTACYSGHHQAPVLIATRHTWCNGMRAVEKDARLTDLSGSAWSSLSRTRGPSATELQQIARIPNAGLFDYNVLTWVTHYIHDLTFVDNMATDGTYMAHIYNLVPGSSFEAYVDSSNVANFPCSTPSAPYYDGSDYNASMIGKTVGVDLTQLNYPIGSSGIPTAGGGTTALSTLDWQ
ncbi:MAG: hypothetical protein D6692_07140 [Planctomycetota bacterium]|nr:MAG: hypothetical protein D6692_07140 [Planctomycetota bacterium]